LIKNWSREPREGIAGISLMDGGVGCHSLGCIGKQRLTLDLKGNSPSAIFRGISEKKDGWERAQRLGGFFEMSEKDGKKTKKLEMPSINDKGGKGSKPHEGGTSQERVRQ